MSRNRKVFCVLAVVIGLSALGVFFILPHEPSYQGRRLSAWLSDFEADRPEVREMAAKAVRHIGRDAVPFLVQRLKSPNPALSRDSSLARLKRRVVDWLSQSSPIKITLGRPANPRMQALAALDALGPKASDALPVLENLLHQQRPDTKALYVAARVGPLGQPLLMRSLTNENRVVRLQARVCLEMIRTHAKELYPEANSGTEFSDFYRRISQLNLKTLRASSDEFRLQRPGAAFPNAPFDNPPPSLPPEVVQGLLTNWYRQQAGGSAPRHE